MKLYYTKGACSLASHIVINELGLPCEYEAVDLATKQSASGKDYTTINPKGAVPALQLNDGEVLTENAVIMQYLADTARATQLLPALGDFNRYRVLEWLNFIGTDIHKSFGALFNPHFPQDVKDKITIPMIKTKFNQINGHLDQNKYLFNDHFTLPDAYLFVMLTWAHHFKLHVDKEWPQTAAYFAELVNRKSIQQSLQEEGIHLATTA
jgi:glutathione S-transferase